MNGCEGKDSCVSITLDHFHRSRWCEGWNKTENEILTYDTRLSWLVKSTYGWRESYGALKKYKCINTYTAVASSSLHCYYLAELDPMQCNTNTVFSPK